MKDDKEQNNHKNIAQRVLKAVRASQRSAIMRISAAIGLPVISQPKLAGRGYLTYFQ